MSVQAPVGTLDGDTQVMATLTTPFAPSSRRVEPQGLRRVVEGPVAGTVAVAAVASFPVVEAVRLLVGTGRVVLSPGSAFSELAARRASHLHQVMGPLTRFGFHQPGPALYYLLAVFVRLGPATRGVLVGAVVINGAVLAAAVAVTWRRFGGATALWTATVIDLWCVCVGVGPLRDAGNTAMLVAPIVLFVVLWAAAVSGTRGAFVWAVIVASFEVQTDAATGIFCLAMLLIGAVAAMVAAGADGRLQLPYRWYSSPARSVGLLVLVAAWIPTVVGLTGGRPDNVRALYHFVTHAYPTPGLHRAATAAVNAMTALPLGRTHPAGSQVARSTVALVAVGLGALLLLAVTIWLAYQRRSRAAYSFTAAAVVGGATGAFSLTRTVAGHGPPTAAWLAYVPLALLVALGAALLGTLGPERAGPGFVATAKAPFKWFKKRLSKRAKGGVTAARSRETHRRRRGKEAKVGGKLASRSKAAGKSAAGRRLLVPSPQWARPAVWVVPVLIVVTAGAAGTVIGANLRDPQPHRFAPTQSARTQTARTQTVQTQTAQTHRAARPGGVVVVAPPPGT